MSDHENLRATAEARRAAERSSAPLSRHDAALQRYLGAMQHASGAAHDFDAWLPPPFVHSGSALAAEQTPLAAIDDDSDATHQQRANLVVVGVDGSEHAHRAAVWAASEAVHRHAALRLVYAYSLPIAGYAGYSMAPDDLGSILRAEGRKMLREISDDLRADNPGLDIEIRLFQGDPVVALRRESELARLTVVGSRGNGRVSGLLLGSVAMSITAHGTAPVAIIPAEGPGWARKGPVVVGVDGSATSEAAIRFGFEEAAVRGSELIAVHTWNQPRPGLVDVSPLDIAKVDNAERALLSEELAGWRDKYPDVPVQQNVIRGRATQTLLTFAGYAQLLVVGSRGRGGFAGMVLGSTSHSLISHALCPVVVVRPDSLD